MNTINIPSGLLPDGVPASCGYSHTQRATGHSFVLLLLLQPVGLNSQMFGPNAKFVDPPFEEECPPQGQIHNGTAGSVDADGSGADGVS